MVASRLDGLARQYDCLLVVVVAALFCGWLLQDPIRRYFGNLRNLRWKMSGIIILTGGSK